MSAADVKMEIPVPVRSLKSSILSSTTIQMDDTFRGVVSAAVEQSRREANMVTRGDGKFGPREADTTESQNQKRYLLMHKQRKHL